MALGPNLEMDGVAGATGSHHVPNGVDAAAIREQCDRILSDPLFSHSKRYSGLLSYIVDKTLDGQYECLKERIIGIEVLGRSPDFNSNQDATVRAVITEVRKRLIRYFDAPEHHQELRIELPIGSYIAEFSLPKSAQVTEETKGKQPIISGASQRRRLFIAFSVVVTVAIVLSAGYWGVKHLGSASPIDEFWAPIMNSSGPVLISIGLPAVNVPQPSEQAAAGGDLTLGQFIAQQADYPVAELRAAEAFNTFIAQHGKHSTTRVAQTTSLSDLQSASAIILGSTLNQWVVRLESGLHFHFQRQNGKGLSWIEDMSDPENRKWATDSETSYTKVEAEYVLITRELSPTTGQWWVGVGGTTVLGTLAAQRMLIDPRSMETFTSELPKGWEHKNIQVVVEFKMVDGSLGASHVVGSYLW
jgi:hypothetical protein